MNQAFADVIYLFGIFLLLCLLYWLSNYLDNKLTEQIKQNKKREDQNSGKAKQ